jgi:hypothetical protein
MEKKQQFNIYLSPDLIRAVKHAAVDVGGSLSDFVAEALERHVRKPQGAGEELPHSATTSAEAVTPKLILMTLVYVRSIDAVLPFYEALGFQMAVRDRAGEWVELHLGSAILMLHRSEHPSSEAPRSIELSFVSAEPLEEVLARLTAAGVPSDHPIIDESFGRYVQLQAPDGLVLQINEHDRTLYT